MSDHTREPSRREPAPEAGALTPTARRLERLLGELPEHRRARLTNDWLATQLGVSSRSVTTALSRLAASGRITIDSRRGHPLEDRSARTIHLNIEGGER